MEGFYTDKGSLNIMKFGGVREFTFGIRVAPGGGCTSQAAQIKNTFSEKVFFWKSFSDSSDVVGAEIRESFVQTYSARQFFHGLLGMENCQIRQVGKEPFCSSHISLGGREESLNERRDHRGGNISR